MINLKDKVIDATHDKIYDVVYSQIAPDLGFKVNNQILIKVREKVFPTFRQVFNEVHKAP